ncbi:hypothetical protein MSKU15_2140 [Komagataeibacter diospyri]|nr:hypothetical protein MSKU15_2140 [Komagataeibacter diospyri]
MGLREPDEIRMFWTEITRAQYQRDDLEYASDLRDAEWALIAPLMPERKRSGRPRRTDLRRVMEAILHIVTTGCQWRQLPRHFPAFTTVQGYLYRWIREGRWETMNHILVILSREQDGRDATPSVGIMTASRLKPLKMAAHAVMTQARRSRDASGISRPTRRVMSWRLSYIPLTFRIVMVRRW